MKIFLCWSQTRSRLAAECLQRALKRLDLEVSMSPGIGKGSVWFDEITRSLRSVEAGIVILTPENLRSGWIHFEAGFLARPLQGRKRPRIIPYLFHHELLPVEGPLGQYQLTVATGEDTLAMVSQLLDSRTNWPPRNAVFREREARERQWHWWNDLAKDFRLQAATVSPNAAAPELAGLFRRKTFLEPLDQCVAEFWLARYDGAQATLTALRGMAPEIHRQCRPYARDLFDQLVQATDSYVMAMGKLLLGRLPFCLKDNGRLSILPPGILRACEDPRLEILRLQSALVTDSLAPAYEESAMFARLESFPQKKDVVHKLEVEIRRTSRSSGASHHGKPRARGDAVQAKDGNSTERASRWWLPPFLDPAEALTRASTSSWALDRIAFYLHQRSTPSVSLEDALEYVWIEWEKVRALDKPDASRMALHYALDVLEAVLERKQWRVKRPSLTGLKQLFQYLEELEQDVPSSGVARRVQDFKAWLNSTGGQKAG